MIMESRVSAIILAAGKSTRMGHPKALVKFNGGSFLQTIMKNFNQAGVEDIVVVLGHDSETIAEKLRLPDKPLVINENYEMGQFSSFQTGIRALSKHTTGVFLALVDQPQIGAEVIRSLLASFLANPDRILIPTYRGHRGHPTVFPGRLFEEIRTAPATISARDILTDHQADILELEVQDESILWNINTKSDLQQIQRRMTTLKED